MNRRTKQTRSEALQGIIEEYIKSGQPWPARMIDVARWAIKLGKWSADRVSMAQICASELSRAAREEYFTDPQGRRVRRKHAARFTESTPEGEKQLVLWANIEEATPKHMRVALGGRRGGVLSDVLQLHTDLASYNDNNKHGAHLEMSFNFETDIEERANPTDYPGIKPTDDEDGDDLPTAV